MKESTWRSLYFLLFIPCFLTLSGCQKVTSAHNTKLKNNQESIKQLSERIRKLETQVIRREKKISVSKGSGPIKTLTLRLGTKDDRLRIYWENGANSDLPCTKEQSTWVCG